MTTHLSVWPSVTIFRTHVYTPLLNKAFRKWFQTLLNRTKQLFLGFLKACSHFSDNRWLHFYLQTCSFYANLEDRRDVDAMFNENVYMWVWKIVTEGQTDSLTNLIKCVVVYHSYSYAFWSTWLWAPVIIC